MGVELQNNFIDRFYCERGDTNFKYQLNGRRTGNCGVFSENASVKQYLKNKVIGSLKSRGIHHVAADFSPKPTYPMTVEEIEKDKRRRQSNRDSARKCRERQKEEERKNRKLLSQLTTQRDKLLDYVNTAEDEKNRLLFDLKQVLPNSYITEALRNVQNMTSDGEKCFTDLSSVCEDSNPVNSPNCAENFILEESSSCESIVLTSLENFNSDEGIMNGSVQYLDVINEETVPFIAFNYDESEIGLSVVQDGQGVSQTLL